MLGPLVTLGTNILTSALSLVPLVVGGGLLIAGGTLALGNHARGKEGMICALIGGAVMLTSLTIGQAVHA